MNYLKQHHLSILIVAFLVVSSFFGGAPSFGATTARTTITNPWTFSQAVTHGSTGTAISRINTGTCYIQAYATTIAASSTVAVDCQATAAVGGITTANDVALTGVTFGDFVVGNLSTTTAAAGGAFMGIIANGVSASTTAGYLSVRITNLSGTTFTWPTTGTATGTISYFVAK